MEALTLKLKSPAKINLGLRVAGLRPDGYHDIESALQMVSFGDEIALTSQRGGVSCEVTGAELPADERNLAVRAALRLKARARSGQGVHIALTKRVPIAAGLAGGSSNAAAVMLGLCRLWGLDISRQELLEIGAELGSDVPFFLTSAAAWAEGRGEVLSPLPPLEGMGIVLVNPGFQVSTSWAYREVNFGLTSAEKALNMLRFLLEKRRFTEIGPYLHNDFESLVEGAHPDIGAIRAALRAQGALGVALSGSGPTVFGLFPEAASAAAASLARPGWSTVATVPITDWPGALFAPLETTGQGGEPP